MQVEIVRHHRRAEDADGDVEHLAVPQNFCARDEPEGERAESRLGEPHLDREGPRDEDDQGNDQRLDVAEAAVLQKKDHQHIERGQAHPPYERESQEQVQRDRRAQHFGEVAGRDRDFAQDPEEERGRARIAVAAGLGEVASAGDAEARGQGLKQNRHQVGDHDDGEKGVAEPGAASQVGGPVARIHVTNSDQIPRARKGEEFAPEAGFVGNRNGPVNFRETR